MLKRHRLLVWTAQLAIFVLAGVGAFLLRFDFAIPASVLRYLALGLAVWLLVKSVVFRVAGLDRGWWRYVSVVDIFRIGLGNCAGSAISYLVIRTLGPPGFPRSIYVLDLILCFLGTAGVRVVVRMVAEATRSSGNGNGGSKRTLIYGAGDAGVGLLRETRQNPSLPYAVVGFVDDDPRKSGMRILGATVYGAEQLAATVRKLRVDMVLIAIPSATGTHMTAILRRCIAAGVAYKTIPGLGDVIETKALASQIREVAVEDLLGRNPVRLEVDRIRSRVEGKVVMVTGAAGSIGSEICRQVARFLPRGIVAFEIAETALFHLEREMLASFPGVAFHAEIGNVQNAARVAEVMAAYGPSMVFHAAAYKHVPMMEAHLFEAVENNVFGTRTVAEAAARHGVEEFVMISTDKAVRPTNVMGATKRLAELVIQEWGQTQLSPSENGVCPHSSTKYVAVRFGNVLGSNGSVIPIFKQQIAAGGPVTVTHPEMRRFFMTIPEAVQLVLQAATLGKGGEIFVLDMGEPVKILDLATNLILLSGLRPDEDIQIEFTGMRPGEKLYEEVAAIEESTLPTSHEKIMVFGGAAALPSFMMGRIEAVCASRDVRSLVLLLKELVPEYNPSVKILSQAFNDGGVRAAVAE
jgi:FlaA1/EpsC-like NDP-sugar epimerase